MRLSGLLAGFVVLSLAAQTHPSGQTPARAPNRSRRRRLRSSSTSSCATGTDGRSSTCRPSDFEIAEDGVAQKVDIVHARDARRRHRRERRLAVAGHDDCRVAGPRRRPRQRRRREPPRTTTHDGDRLRSPVVGIAAAGAARDARLHPVERRVERARRRVRGGSGHPRASGVHQRSPAGATGRRPGHPVGDIRRRTDGRTHGRARGAARDASGRGQQLRRQQRDGGGGAAWLAPLRRSGSARPSCSMVQAELNMIRSFEQIDRDYKGYDIAHGLQAVVRSLATVSAAARPSCSFRRVFRYRRRSRPGSIRSSTPPTART